MGDIDDLPVGWVVTELENIAKWGAGGTPSRKNTSYYGGDIPWVKTGDLGPRRLREASECITDEGLKNSSAKVFPKNSVAIAMYGATIGKTSIFDIDAATNQACAVAAASNGISNDFLYYLLNNEKENFINKGKGGAQPNISQTIIKAHTVALPPSNEQTRIANKLDELLAQVDTIKARVDAIPGILKRFRQSVLAAAVSGRLTEEWRGSDDYEQVGEYLSVPDSWNQCSVADIADYVTSGSRGWAKYYSDEGSLFIRSQDINTDELQIEEAAFVSLPDKAEGRRTKVSKEDLLITITGANVTKCARLKDGLDDAYISQHVALIRLQDTGCAKFVELALKAENAGRKQLTDMAYGGGKPGLNLQNIKDVQFALPDENEQAFIVSRVEDLLATADQIERAVREAKARIAILTQSILAKAFRGELVPQSRDDEPASVLLERIQGDGGGEK